MTASFRGVQAGAFLNALLLAVTIPILICLCCRYVWHFPYHTVYQVTRGASFGVLPALICSFPTKLILRSKEFRPAFLQNRVETILASRNFRPVRSANAIEYWGSKSFDRWKEESVELQIVHDDLIVRASLASNLCIKRRMTELAVGEA